MQRTKARSLALAAALALALVACSSSDDKSSNNGGGSGDTTEASASDNASSAEQAVAALDALGIEHSDPVRRDVGLSGAKAGFDITVNGYDAGINVFPDTEALERWQEASDSMGGVHVAYGTAVLSLNSSEGIADSVEIAPQIAAELNGEARGV